jgi:hypothetical protein
MAKKLTEEEKVAIKLDELVSDLRLDLDMIGIYLGQIVRGYNYNRIKTITESLDREMNK